MRCARCQSLQDRVIDSRMSRDGTAIRRRRICEGCGYRFTTYEQIELMELRVIKKNSAREDLNREKLKRGLVKACQKRPVSLETIEKAVDAIIAELQHEFVREVPSSEIGLKVMAKLREIDPVAYVRYASVYRQFQNVDEFIQEIQNNMGGWSERQPKPGADNDFSA